MESTTTAVLRAIMLGDPTLSGAERKALLGFIERGTIAVTQLDGPLLLSATKAAAALGVSVDTFKRIRDAARENGVHELTGILVSPGTVMFSTRALERFATGEISLRWEQRSQTSVDNGAAKIALVEEMAG